jgi:hypothetical protein
MPRPHTKELLLRESQKEHDALEESLAALESRQMTEAGIVGEWSVKDVLAHLYEWEQMVLHWWRSSQQGETPHVPAEGYKWNQLPALNEEIWVKHRDRSLDQVLEMVRSSFGEVMQTIEGIPEETLFTPGLYAWMNKNTLASYFTSCTSSHYRWARKEVRKGLRAAG